MKKIKDKLEEEGILIERGDNEFLEKLSDTYKKDEVCVLFQNNPSEENINDAKAFLKELRKKSKANDEPWDIEVQKCDGCDCPVVLFKGKDLDSIIVGDTVRTGTVSPTGKVGEEYSLNFYKKIPLDVMNLIDLKEDIDEYDNVNKNEIVVAVLDTGLDTKLINPNYLWRNTSKDTEPTCYQGAKSGWNFVENTSANGNNHPCLEDDPPCFADDDPNRHGTIVSQYIINQFKKSPINSVKIMPLKTHDKDGVGDLFGILCAIYFAMVKGANIINASWGLYCYYGDPFKVMSLLIKNKLQEKGVLFITAAGNKDVAEEEIALEIYKKRYKKDLTDEHLRNIAIHHFYPAHLSAQRQKNKEKIEIVEVNNVITVTTTDGITVCDTQNYSDKYVDLGVKADVADREGMRFQVPFPCKPPNNLPISGSSFATAIATGVIGAYCPKNLYKKDLNKNEFFHHLKKQSYIPVEKGKNKLEKQIRKGRYIIHS